MTTEPEDSDAKVPEDITIVPEVMELMVIGALLGENATFSADMVEVMVLEAPEIFTKTGAEVLPLEIGLPTMINWLIVATVPVPLDGTPEVTPTEVRSAICLEP